MGESGRTNHCVLWMLRNAEELMVSGTSGLDIGLDWKKRKNWWKSWKYQTIRFPSWLHTTAFLQPMKKPGVKFSHYGYWVRQVLNWGILTIPRTCCVGPHYNCRNYVESYMLNCESLVIFFPCLVLKNILSWIISPGKRLEKSFLGKMTSLRKSLIYWIEGCQWNCCILIWSCYIKAQQLSR